MVTTFRWFVISAMCFFFSCKTKTDLTKNYNNSSLVGFNLIKRCVDSLTNIQPSMNTKNYVLDLSSIDSLNKDAVDSFLKIKNVHLPTTSDDSLMIFKDGNFSDFHMKQSMIIKISAINYKNAKVALVTASKIKSTNEIINATIELERQSDGYKIKHLKITN
ncbi:MAG: hypothetical protein EOP48_16815 [Sphingobacteriales bacterium]|nr:MAG: hypothetical protein EOP48_16815 [Sphingobacteriales bacterium]